MPASSSTSDSSSEQEDGEIVGASLEGTVLVAAGGDAQASQHGARGSSGSGAATNAQSGKLALKQRLAMLAQDACMDSVRPAQQGSGPGYVEAVYKNVRRCAVTVDATDEEHAAAPSACMFIYASSAFWWQQ